MSVYVISDLHLSVACPEKAMDAFGHRWVQYIDKIQKGWNACVGPQDTVFVPGDISWAMTLEEAVSDLSFVDSALNGKKILMKGNHDFWWTSLKKMNCALEEAGIRSISFLQNNAVSVEGKTFCGSRGWFQDEKSQVTVGNADFTKITARELIRLRLSLEQAAENSSPYVLFHFPPLWNGFYQRDIIDVLHQYNVSDCYFGHVHGQYNVPAVQTFESIRFHFVSADFLEFVPRKIT